VGVLVERCRLGHINLAIIDTLQKSWIGRNEGLECSTDSTPMVGLLQSS